MAGQNPVLWVEIVPTTKGIGRTVEKEFTSGFDGVEKQGKSMFGRLAGFAKGAAATVIGIGTAVAGLSIKGGISRLLNIEDAQAKLKGLGHDTQSVTAIMGSALDSVRGTAFGLDTAATVAASAVAAGIKPGQELTRYLKLTADAATIAGSSMGEMGDIINQVTSKGRAGMENLNRLTERGVPIVQWLAAEYGVTADELSKMVSRGEVDAETFRRAIENNIGGAALASGNTTRGAFANMLASLSRVGANLVGGVFPLFREAFAGITEAMGPLEDRARSAGEAITLYLEPVARRMIDGFSSVGPAISGVVDSLGPALAPLAALAAGALAPLMSSLPVIGRFLPVITGPIGLLAGAIGALLAISPELRSALGGSFEMVAGAVGEVMPMLQPLIPVFASLAAAVGSVLADALVTVTPLVVQLVELFGGALLAVMPTVVSLLGGLAAFLAENADLTLMFVAAITGAVLAFQAYTAVLTVIRTVTMAWAAVQAVLNVVLTANPIGLIVTAIGALVAAIIWVATQTTFFQDTWAALSTFFVGVWENGIKPVIDGIGAGFAWLYENGIKPHVDAIAAIFSWIYSSIIDPIAKLILISVGMISIGFKIANEKVIRPALDAIGAAMTWVYESIIAPVAGFIRTMLDMVGLGFTIFYRAAVKPAIDAVGAAFQWLNTSIFQPVGSAISSAVEAIGAVIGAVFGTAGDIIRGAFNGVVDFVRGVFNGIIDAINGVIRGINEVAVVAGAALGMDLRLSLLPRLAAGALIHATNGGSPVVVGEGRYDEAVLPLGGPVLDKIRAALQGGRESEGGPTNEFNFTGVDPESVADAFMQRFGSKVSLL